MCMLGTYLSVYPYILVLGTMEEWMWAFGSSTLLPLLTQHNSMYHHKSSLLFLLRVLILDRGWGSQGSVHFNTCGPWMSFNALRKGWTEVLAYIVVIIKIVVIIIIIIIMYGNMHSVSVCTFFIEFLHESSQSQVTLLTWAMSGIL